MTLKDEIDKIKDWLIKDYQKIAYGSEKTFKASEQLKRLNFKLKEWEIESKDSIKVSFIRVFQFSQRILKAKLKLGQINQDEYIKRTIKYSEDIRTKNNRGNTNSKSDYYIKRNKIIVKKAIQLGWNDINSEYGRMKEIYYELLDYFKNEFPELKKPSSYRNILKKQ